MYAIALTQIEYVLTIKRCKFPSQKKCIFFTKKRNTPRLTSFLRLAPGNVEVPPGPNRISSSSRAAASSTLLSHHVLHDGRGDRRLLLRRRHGRARTRTSAEPGDPTAAGTPGRRRDRWEEGRGSRWRGARFLIPADGMVWWWWRSRGGEGGVGVFEVGTGKRVEIGGL